MTISKTGTLFTLDHLQAGQRARICEVSTSVSSHEKDFSKRLLEMGFIPNTIVEVLYIAPFGGSMAIQCRGSLIAVRKKFAKSIKVELL